MITKRPVYAINFSYLRNLRRLTRKDISEKTGIPASTWGSYEEGRAFPHWEKLLIICDLLEYRDIYRLLSEDLSMQGHQKKEVVISEAKSAIDTLNIFVSMHGSQI